MQIRFRNHGKSNKVPSNDQSKKNSVNSEYKFGQNERNFTQALVGSIPYFNTISMLKTSYTRKHATDKGVPSMCIVINQADLARALKELQTRNIYPKKQEENKWDQTVLLVFKDDYQTLLNKLKVKAVEKKEENAPASASMFYQKEQKPQSLTKTIEQEVYKTISDFDACCKALDEQEDIVKKWKVTADLKSEPIILNFDLLKDNVKIGGGLMLRFSEKADCQKAFAVLKRNNITAELLPDMMCPFDDHKLDMIRLDGVENMSSLMEIFKKCNAVQSEVQMQTAVQHDASHQLDCRA